ncbi:OmpA family protein [Actinomadura algeriensis]|uniref:Outer membrane protein OmpA-like peptidoglycan-associated protein n=1 Tax=Actinomadura algeriensis TaxID=1679523 RepID=A0ABR9JUD7_9ACTN|nr:OmpA family protein [Actinomadura algeriensis]MBE1534182.1 outer membrane protein OmpA-like peptidoglycan-associated protein [Actinomadura algeriensis]
MRRKTVIASVVVFTLGVPAVAAAEPDVPDAAVTASVRGIDAASAVRDIDLSESVVDLEREESTDGRVTVQISSDVLFEFDKATLTDDARRHIAELARRLRAASGTVEVSGHTDSRGEPDYNRKLSQQRADAVKADLLRHLTGAGVEITAEGHGETDPVAPNEVNGEDDPEGRAQNRRVEISFNES